MHEAAGRAAPSSQKQNPGSLINTGFIKPPGVSYKHETGFEPATLALARRYSTTEPLVHILVLSNKDIIL